MPRQKLALLVCIFLTICASPVTAWAWGYAEHVQISLDAFNQACDEDGWSARSAEVASICDSELIKYCYAHMVAVAGDHAALPEYFLMKDQNLLYNKRHAIDCRNIGALLDDKTIPPERENLEHLHKTGLNGSFTYVNLLTNNSSHFRPESADRWVFHVTNSLGTVITVQTAFANHAFSSHFLQDSFAAGHSGIQRGKQRQDYDQAYHDDMNATGVFLKNRQGHVWHSYGDKGLDRLSRYLPSRFCTDQRDLNDIHSELTRKLDAKFEEFNENQTDFNCDEDKVQVLSLAKQARNPFKPCFIFDNCDKVELLMPNAIGAGIRPENCGDNETTDLFECNSSSFFVSQATKENVRLLLERLDSHFIGGTYDDANLIEVVKWIPHKMRAVEYDTGDAGYLNKKSFVLTYGEWMEIDSKENDTNLIFQNFQVGIFARDAGIRQLDDVTLYFGSMLKNDDHTKKSDTDVSEYPNFLQHIGSRSRVDVRLHMISDDGSFLDGLEANWGYTFERMWHNVFGVTLNLALGADDVWGGTAHRNWYYGGGIEFNMHVGRNIIFVEAQSTRHRGPNFDWDKSTQIVLGWRVSAIDFGG